MQVTGLSKDLHSGKFGELYSSAIVFVHELVGAGGAVHEPMIDLMQVLSSMSDSSGNILIEGVMDSVAPLTPAEEALYADLSFSEDGLKKVVGASKLLYEGESHNLFRFHFSSQKIQNSIGTFCSFEKIIAFDRI